MKKLLLILFMSFPFIVKGEVVEFDKCVDGDTFKAKRNGEVITIRILAVDTPESTKEVEPYGKEASEFTCNMLTNGKKIELEYDENSDKEDKYRRVLSWVFIDGKLLESELIKNGLAEVAYLYGDYKYTPLLQDYEAVARSKKIGIWSENNIEITVTNTDNKDNSSIEDRFGKIAEEYGLLIAILVAIVSLVSDYFEKKLKKKK